MVCLDSSLWKTIFALAIAYLIEDTRSSPREIIEKKIIHIAGIFNEGQEREIVAFKAAISQINMNRLLLPHVKLEPKIEMISPPDSFITGKRVCNLTNEGVAAIFGPSYPESAGIVQSLCDTMDIPHFLTHWNPSSFMAPDQFNMYPDPKLLSLALVDVLADMEWKGFTIIYENDEGLVRLQEVLKSHSPHDPPITVRQLGPGPDYRPLLKEIHNSSETHIVLDVETDHILEIFRQAKEVKMIDVYHSYLVTSLDAHTLDYGDLKGGLTNISGIRFVSPQAYEVQSAVQDFKYTAKFEYPTLDLDFSPDTLRVSTALMYDAVYLFAESLDKVDTDNAIEPERISCDETTKWSHGNSLINFMKLMSLEGLTGVINFNGSNYRNDFMLELLELHTGKKRATWSPYGKPQRLNLTRTGEEMERDLGDNLVNQTLRVVSRIGEPYMSLKNNSDQLVGNDKFEGFAVDLIVAIAEELKFKPDFYIVDDYGSYNPAQKKWDGIVGELIDRRADLGICDLTITSDREKVVDFTMPFMNLGISILFRKPEKKDANLFSFLDPFDKDVWLYMATAYMGVSVVLFILARITPYEWDNPHPCNPDPEELENTFSLLNSLWFAIGSLMQQGCDFLPKAVSTRIVAGMWWFFTLIMISSYTANLAAFLTADRMEETIKSADDLAKQTKIKYGSIGKGSTKSFFQNSNYTTYQRMWATMDSAQPSVFTKSNKEGVARVLKEKKFAFLMESTSIEYEVAQHCELQQVGGLLDSKGYGIAMPVDSPYRTLISGAVLKLQETGKLRNLKDLWWRKKDGEDCPSDSSAGEESAELGLENVGGVFVVLIAGCGFAFVLTILEFLWNLRKVAIEEKITPKEALALEMKFAMRCRGTTKPVHRKSSETPESNVSRSLMRLNVFQKLDNSDK